MSKSRRQRGTGSVIPHKQKNGDVTFYVQFYGGDGKQVKEHVGKVPGDGTYGWASEGWTQEKADRFAAKFGDCCCDRPLPS